MQSLFLSLVLLAPAALFPQVQTAQPQKGQALPSPELKDWKAAIAHVLPSPAETAWLDLPWQPTLRAGLVTGAAEKKPVLLWAMNGHPLAST